MSYQPPERHRHVTPMRERTQQGYREGRDGIAPPEADPVNRVGHVSSLSRSEAAIGLSERRRLRRLQKAADENVLPPAAVPRGMPFQVYVSWRWFSAFIVLALLSVLYLFFTRDFFYIHEIYVGGTKYLTPGKIFERSGLANEHIFWVDPAAVEAKLEEDTSIANASVAVGWPPNMVQITITEREPALIWEQGGLRVWLDVRGRVMALRRDDPALVRVVVEKPSRVTHIGDCPLQGMDEVLGPGSCIDTDIVAGALQFKALYPNVDEMVYDPAKGLGYHDGRGWVLWFGNGTDIVTKMDVYQQIVNMILADRKHPIEVNVADPDAPYYVTAPS